MLTADIVNEAIICKDFMNAYGFVVHFKNIVLRIGQELVIISATKMSDKSMDEINQVAVYMLRNQKENDC